MTTRANLKRKNLQKYAVRTVYSKNKLSHIDFFKECKVLNVF